MLKSNQWAEIQSSGMLQGGVTRAFVLVAHQVSTKRTFAIELNDRNQIGSKLNEILGEGVITDFEFKAFGDAALIFELKRSLVHVGAKLKSEKSSVNSKIDYVIYGSDGRIRVAEELVSKAKIKVLIVDDSKVIRTLLTRLFESDPHLEVVGACENPLKVEAMIQSLKPDVLTLDIHMPEMNGVELLRKILPIYSIPTVMISSISMNESDDILNALEIGAVDYIQKPAATDLPTIGPLMIEKIKVASAVRLKKNRGEDVARNSGQNQKVVRFDEKMDLSQLIAIGSSTGGTEALKEILIRLPAEIPPIVIVQHIPAVFSLALALRLNDLCPFEVKEAKNGDRIQAGRVLIAPGGMQMKVCADGRGNFVEVFDGAPVNRHKPSVDVLFDSVVENSNAKKAIGIILTGMGADGAKGLLKMRKSGSRTIAQNEESCVVYGMPKEAVALGAVEKIMPLTEIAGLVVSWAAAKKLAAS